MLKMPPPTRIARSVVDGLRSAAMRSCTCAGTSDAIVAFDSANARGSHGIGSARAPERWQRAYTPRPPTWKGGRTAAQTSRDVTASRSFTAAAEARIAFFDNATSLMSPVDPEVATKTCASSFRTILSNRARSSDGIRGLRRRWDSEDWKSITDAPVAPAARRLDRRRLGGELNSAHASEPLAVQPPS